MTNQLKLISDELATEILDHCKAILKTFEKANPKLAKTDPTYVKFKRMLFVASFGRLTKPSYESVVRWLSLPEGPYDNLTNTAVLRIALLNGYMSHFQIGKISAHATPFLFDYRLKYTTEQKKWAEKNLVPVDNVLSVNDVAVSQDNFQCVILHIAEDGEGKNIRTVVYRPFNKRSEIYTLEYKKFVTKFRNWGRLC